MVLEPEVSACESKKFLTVTFLFLIHAQSQDKDTQYVSLNPADVCLENKHLIASCDTVHNFNLALPLALESGPGAGLQKNLYLPSSCKTGTLLAHGS